ncbi:MAG TPA: hypothetical protein VIM73_05630 [Polyangiaceae bacterium]
MNPRLRRGTSMGPAVVTAGALLLGACGGKARDGAGMDDGHVMGGSSVNGGRLGADGAQSTGGAGEASSQGGEAGQPAIGKGGSLGDGWAGSFSIDTGGDGGASIAGSDQGGAPARDVTARFYLVEPPPFPILAEGLTAQQHRVTPLCVNADVSVALGLSTFTILEQTGRVQAFRWTPESGTKSLGPMPGATADQPGAAVLTAIDADCSVAAGFVDYPDRTSAFYWSEAEGIVDITVSGSERSRATWMSEDGIYVIGHTVRPDGIFFWSRQQRAVTWVETPPRYELLTARVEGDGVFGLAGHASCDNGLNDRSCRIPAGSALQRFRWTASGLEWSAVPVGVLSNEHCAVSASTGEFLAGICSLQGPHSVSPFVWSERHGERSFPESLPIGSTLLRVSRDGSVVVGDAPGEPPDNGRMWVWTHGAGQDAIEWLSPRRWTSWPQLSHDGSILALSTSQGVRDVAVRWSLERGEEELPDIPGHLGSRIQSLSADGATITGVGREAEINVPVIWRNAAEARLVSEVLRAGGASVEDSVEFESAFTGRDGRTLYGEASAESLQPAQESLVGYGWVAWLPE